MDVSVFKPSNDKFRVSEGTIFNAIKSYIKTNNFPKKLLLKKLDMYIEKRKGQVAKYSKMIKLAEKSNKEMFAQIEILKDRNSKDLQELIDFLS